MKLNRLLLLAALSLAACEVSTNPIVTDPDAPANLTYQLIPSGDPDQPLGVLLTWEIPSERSCELVQRLRTRDERRGLAAARNDDVAHVPRRRYSRSAVLRRDARCRRQRARELEHHHRRPAGAASRRRRASGRSRSTPRSSSSGSPNAVNASAYVRPLPRLFQQLRRARARSARGLGVRRFDGLRWLPRRQSHERHVAVLRGERGDASTATRACGAPRGWIRRATTRATCSSTIARRAPTAPASCSSTRSPRRSGRSATRRAPISISRSRRHDDGSLWFSPGAHRCDHGVVFDDAGHRSHVDRQGAVDRPGGRVDRSDSGIRVRIPRSEDGRRPLCRGARRLRRRRTTSSSTGRIRARSATRSSIVKP